MYLDSNNLNDSFIHSLNRVNLYYKANIPIWRIIGDIAHGTRITIAMNVKTGKEIGHPCANYIWDIISVADQTFANLGMDWELYIGKGYVGSARNTSAQSSRTVSDNIKIIDIEDPNLGYINKPVIYVTKNHEWTFCAEGLDTTNMDFNFTPFGAIFLIINNFEPPEFSLEDSIFNYIINTLERGEEPMETIGRGGFSAVSGWKAYARWMQAFQVPLQGIKHEKFNDINKQILERRQGYLIYLNNLNEIITDLNWQRNLNNLVEKYNEVINKLEMVSTEITYDDVKQIYFSEQKTLPTYKEIKKLL